MLKKTTQLEIDSYLKKFIFKTKSFSYKKQSFSEARQKIKSKTFKYLNRKLIRKFYETAFYKKYKNYRLLAIDVTYVEIPDNIETQEYYGYATNGNKNFKIARAASSKVYDLENNILVNSVLGKYTDGEIDLATRNINEMLKNRSIPEKNIILFDKAYPSIDFINYLDSKNIKYFMRIKTKLFEEVKKVGAFGEIIKIVVTRNRAKALKRKGLNYKIGTKITFRVFKFIIDGEEEIVITNLDKNELSYKEALQLFHRRWGIEVKFNELKNRFEIENISGEKVQTIEQDFYASILLCNIATLKYQMKLMRKYKKITKLKI